MVKVVLSETSMEMPPISSPDINNGDGKRGTDDASNDGSSLGLDLNSQDGGGSHDESGYSERDANSEKHRMIRLETENESLRVQIALMRKEFDKIALREGTDRPHQATLHSPLRSRPFQRAKPIDTEDTKNTPKDMESPQRKQRRRRWSLSSAEDPEMGLFPLDGEVNSSLAIDSAEAVFRDNEIDPNSTGRGLHHRRGGDHLPKTAAFATPPRRGIKQKRSDAFSDDENNTEADVDQEQFALVATSQTDAGMSDAVLDFHNTTFWDDVKDRAGWLVGLMVLQSLSSFIIKWNEKLLEEHIVIVQFLTMLVGAGGNAGNQASVRVIRGLAIGAVTNSNVKFFLYKEMFMALVLACTLAVSGCIRAAVFATPILETLAITTSLWAIVFASIALGALLPLGMRYVGIDPAHSSTTIQVIMDILGVTITVHVSKTFITIASTWFHG